MPQLEDGYTKIANEILDHLAKTKMSGYQWRCVLFLWRKTYGFNKCEDIIALSQWVEGTGLKKQHICRTLKELIKRKIVTKNGNKYKFNKYYHKYIKLPKMVTLPKMVIPVTKNGNKSLPKMGHTKETNTKETNTKEKERFNARMFLSKRKIKDQTITDWLKARNKKKLANTKTAFERVVKEAEKANIPLQTALTISAENGWGGFRSSWLTKEHMAGDWD